VSRAQERPRDDASRRIVDEKHVGALQKSTADGQYETTSDDSEFRNSLESEQFCKTETLEKAGNCG
jgi:hypothetical protein